MQRSTENNKNHLFNLLQHSSEVFLGLLSFCDDKELFNLMLTSKAFIPFCKNEELWSDLLKRKFPLDNYYPKRLDQPKDRMSSLGIFKNHLLYATYDFVSINFDDHDQTLTIHLLTPSWRREDKGILDADYRSIKTTDNIHPLLKTGIGCKSYQACLDFLLTIQRNRYCKQFSDPNVTISLPYAYTYMGYRKIELCSIERVIEYICNRMEGKTDDFLPKRNSHPHRKSRCSLS